MKYTLTFLATLSLAQAQVCIPSSASLMLDQPSYNSCDSCDPCDSCDRSGRGAAFGSGRGAGFGSGNSVQLGQGDFDHQGGVAKLAASSASSSNQAGSQSIIIPDKNTVTDQAKVSECSSTGDKCSQNCEVAKRVFEINGSISVVEKYNDQAKGQHCASKSGDGNSQTRSRTQVENNYSASHDSDSYGPSSSSIVCQ